MVFVCVFACGYVRESKKHMGGPERQLRCPGAGVKAAVRQLIWVLATELGPSVRAAHGLSCGVISQAPRNIFVDLLV